MSDPLIPLAALLGAASIFLLIKAILGILRPNPRTQRRLDQD